MTEFKHVIDLAHITGGEWYNLDFNRFAINPRYFYGSSKIGGWINEKPWGSQRELQDFGERLDNMIDGYAAATKQVRKQTLEKLVRFHNDGMILWPLSVMIGKSVLGGSTTQRLSAVISEAHTNLAEIRSAFSGATHLEYAQKATKEIICGCMWQLVVGLRFASTAVIDRASDFKGGHLHTVMRLLKPDSVYRSELHPPILSAARALAQFLGPESIGSALLARGNFNRKKKPDLIEERPAPLDWVVRDWDRWVAGQNLMTSHAHRKALSLLVEFLSTLPTEVSSDRAEALSRRSMKSLLAFAGSWSTSSVRSKALSKIKRFCVDRSADSMGDSESPEFPAMLFDHDLEHMKLQPSIRDGENVTRDMTRPMPPQFHELMKEIITGDDFAWAKQLKDRRTGALTQYMTQVAPTGEVKSVFCPVLSRLLLLHLDMPFRNVQIRRLDSGEGDDRRWNPMTGAWEPNTGPHAGHWRRVGAANVERGVFRAIPTEDGNVMTGFWINSNKTQDRKNLFDERSGHRVPWQHEGSLRNLAALRDWQEVNNPVQGPMPHAELDPKTFVDDPTPTVQALIPDRFYLFRYPLNRGHRGREQPPSHHVFTMFFHAALEELERRWNKDNPERKVTIVERRGTGTNARFTVHGMRAATLTELHKAGVPVEIISKLVAGHASILMTFKYFHYKPQHVSDIINTARVQADSARQSEFEDFLKDARFEDALRATAVIGEDRPEPRNGRYDLSMTSRLDFGICPNGGTRCNDGGPRTGNRSSDKFTEVPGGPRNCIRCRHLVTGAPFLVPLLAHANALLAKGEGFARQANEEGEEVLRLKGERARLRFEKKPVPDGMSNRIHSVNEAWMTSCATRNGFLADSHVAMEMVQKVRALGPWSGVPGGASKSVNLPAPADCEVPTVEGRISTRYEVNDFVVQASRCYPSMVSLDAERERDGMTAAIFINNDLMPAWTVMEPAKRRRVADALARLFLEEIGAMEVDRLIDGTRKMDPGLEERLSRLYLATTGKQVLRIGQSMPRVALDAADDGEA